MAIILPPSLEPRHHGAKLRLIHHAAVNQPLQASRFSAAFSVGTQANNPSASADRDHPSAGDDG
jgi:hypothetical protein